MPAPGMWLPSASDQEDMLPEESYRIAALETRIIDLEAEEERLKAACAALETENAALRAKVSVLSRMADVVAEDLHEKHGIPFSISNPWASMYGGHTICADGEPHRPSFSQSGGIVRCARCGNPLGQVSK